MLQYEFSWRITWNWLTQDRKEIESPFDKEPVKNLISSAWRLKQNIIMDDDETGNGRPVSFSNHNKWPNLKCENSPEKSRHTFAVSVRSKQWPPSWIYDALIFASDWHPPWWLLEQKWLNKILQHDLLYNVFLSEKTPCFFYRLQSVLFSSCPLPISIEREYYYLEAKKSNSITTMELIIAYYGEKIEIAFGQVQLHSSQGSKVQDFL